MPVYTWSQTASNNGTADATINFAEGMAPSALNDSARAMMAAFAKFRDDNAGSLLTTGPANAYSVTSNSAFTSLALMSGQKICIRINVACSGASTLNVDGLGAKNIQKAGVATVTGDLVLNGVYDLVYDNSIPAWLMIL